MGVDPKVTSHYEIMVEIKIAKFMYFVDHPFPPLFSFCLGVMILLLPPHMTPDLFFLWEPGFLNQNLC